MKLRFIGQSVLAAAIACTAAESAVASAQQTDATTVKGFALLDLLPDVDLPELPIMLPVPLYTIKVESGGTTVNYVGIIGKRTDVPIRNGLSVDYVTVFLNQDAKDANSYQLQLIRANSSNCTTIPANISAVVNLVPATQVTSGSNKVAELGYKTLHLGRGGTENSPASFITHFTNTDEGIKIQQDTYSTCGEAPMNLVGSFTDEVQNLQLLGFMKTNTSFVANSITKLDGKQSGRAFHMTSTQDIPLLQITGTRQSRPFTIKVQNIPYSVDLCSDPASNRCEEDWRWSKDSLKSFRFDATDYWSNPSPVTLTMDMTQVATDGGNDKHIKITNLTAAHLAYDQHLTIEGEDYDPFESGDFPKWLYMNTNGQPASGYVLSEDVKNGQRQHYLEVNAPSPGLSASNREVSVTRDFTIGNPFLPIPHYELNVHSDGWMSCPSGFDINTDRVQGWIVDTVKSWLCN